MVPKKKISKILKPLAITTYQNLIKEGENNVNMVTLCLMNAQEEYTLGPTSKITVRSPTFPYDKNSDLLFVEHSSIDSPVWFEYKKNVVISKEGVYYLDG